LWIKELEEQAGHFWTTHPRFSDDMSDDIPTTFGRHSDDSRRA
jgi:hypothetical protein